MTMLTLIPARGGSKRLPRKNAKPLQGHPLIAWTIMAAHGLAPAVSSDDDEILDIAARYGARPLRRPPDLASDTASLEAVARHALAAFPADRILLLQPTSPFRPPDLVARALLAYQDGPWGPEPARHVVACKRVRHVYVNGTPLDPAIDVTAPTGALYLASAASILNRHTFTEPGFVALFHDGYSTLDIDTPGDWFIADAIAARHGALWPAADGQVLRPVRDLQPAAVVGG